ncbi:putative necrosis-inducing factor-domain-containing protein [Cladorrhinum sp. PSN332]|nr:putative necrosis-inducing factor-domain-containing protein [Cladorrhinum sp. PSN332]
MRFAMNTKLALALSVLFLGTECAPVADIASHTLSVAEPTVTAVTIPNANQKVFKIADNTDTLKYYAGTGGEAPPEDPNDISPNPTTEVTTKLKKRWGFCGHSTFENRSSGGSPWINDCWVLHNNIAGDGRWGIWGLGWRTLATYGSCAFGVEAIQMPDSFIFVGNEDIRDLIRDSIARFSWNGRVGSYGETDCGTTETHWGVYHT